MEIRYYKNLTIKQNAEKNKCSISTIKAHLQKLNLSASKTRRAIIAEKINNAKSELEKTEKKATIKSICNLTNLSNKTVIKYIKNSEQKDIAKSTPKSYSNFQSEILQNIIFLYNSGNSIECDLTFSLGKIWNKLNAPSLCFDIKPKLPFVRPLEEAKEYKASVGSCLFDLPFIIRPSTNTDNSIIYNRFDAFNSEKELLETNTSMLLLAFDLLKHKGIVIVKTQDTNYANNQIWTHSHIMVEAERIGFKIEDIFICLRKNMLINQNVKSIHARKQHCYFIVLRKNKK